MQVMPVAVLNGHGLAGVSVQQRWAAIALAPTSSARCRSSRACVSQRNHDIELEPVCARSNVLGFCKASIWPSVGRGTSCVETGSHLVLELETVSRTLPKFRAIRSLLVRNRQIQMTNPVGLQQLLDGAAA
jgi:hypothetical protein